MTLTLYFVLTLSVFLSKQCVRSSAFVLRLPCVFIQVQIFAPKNRRIVVQTGFIDLLLFVLARVCFIRHVRLAYAAYAEHMLCMLNVHFVLLLLKKSNKNKNEKYNMCSYKHICLACCYFEHRSILFGIFDTTFPAFTQTEHK